MRFCVIVVAALVACTPAVDAADSGNEASTTAEPAIECVDAMESDIAVTMTPSQLNWDENPLHETCIVTAVSDGEVHRVEMTCPDGLGTIDWSLETSASSVPFADVLAVDQMVELLYFTGTGGGFDPPIVSSAILRAPGEDAPLLVAATGGLPGPHGSTLTWQHVDETTCETQVGSCGFGVMRRVALEFFLEGFGSTIVFDQNEADLGQYRIRVGDAFYDEGNCEGNSESWYEFVAVRTADG